VTQKTKAIKAQSESLASSKLSLCNDGGVCLWVHPKGPGGRSLRVVAGSWCAAGTRPRSRLAQRASRHGRECFNSVDRPYTTP